MQKRRACRKLYKELRDEMSQEQVFRKSDLICRKVLESAEYQAADTIFAYYPLGNEVRCLPVLDHALKAGKRVLLPKTGQLCKMDFFEVTDLDEVEEGTFHVMEPKKGCKKFEEKNSCKEAFSTMLALVPGVVFDREGNRYGYGKGYYDRYFSRFPYIKRIALAYKEQLSEMTLECLDTDVKMHTILTDSERIDIKFNDIGEKNGINRNM